jgi:hypothetical protein
MKHWNKWFSFSGMMVVLLLLAACNLPSAGTPAPDSPSLLYTAAAETVSAQLTQAPPATQAAGLPTATLGVVVPTNTLAPSPTLQPTNTQVPPTATQIPVPCDRASFVSDVSYPDNAEVAQGASFVKTWRIKNTGTCTWNSSYAVVFLRGDSMGGPAASQFTTSSVAPGDSIDISVSLTAPNSIGTYQGFWQLRNSSGALFGIGADARAEFWVKIKTIVAVTPTPKMTVGLDFVDKGPGAEWRNTTTQIPWGDPPEDDAGVAVSLEMMKLENGKAYNRVLATYPQRIDDGFVRGTYASYTVQTGDHFRTLLGFKENCGTGKARFQLVYKEGGTETVFAEWLKICDGNVLTIDQDLASLVGRTLQFIIVVKAEGDYREDRALWVYPRIERQP